MKEGDRVDLVLQSVDADNQTATAQMGSYCGKVEKLKEGESLPHDAVLLKTRGPCAAHPGKLHAEVVYVPEGEPALKASDKHAGPARVSSAKYRSGWDQVFGGKAQRGLA